MISRIEDDIPFSRKSGETSREFIERVGQYTDFNDEEVHELAEDISQYLFAERYRSRKDLERRVQEFINDIEKNHGEVDPDGDESEAGLIDIRGNKKDEVISNSKQHEETEYEKFLTVTSLFRSLFPLTATLNSLSAFYRKLFMSALSTRTESEIGFPRMVTWGVVLLPTLFILPLLLRPLPIDLHAAREVATYFQALSFARDPIQSFTYVSLQESSASIHLYSILASPLVALGYVEGPRLISFVGAIAATLLIAIISEDEWGRPAGAISIGVLWLNPYFIRYSWGAYPEAISLATTSAAVLAILKYLKSGDSKFYTLSLVMVLLGISNHGWEGVISIPIAMLLLHHRKWLQAILIPTISALGLAVNSFLTSLQPNPASAIESYAIFSVGPKILLQPEWWDRYLEAFTRWGGMPAYFTAQRWHFWISILVVIVWGVLYITERDWRHLLIASWGLSGLAIPFGLPGGIVHSYYLWNTIPPITLALTHFVMLIYDETVDSPGGLRQNEVLLPLLLLFAALSATTIAVHEVGVKSDGTVETNWGSAGLLDVKQGEAISAGRKLKDQGVDNFDRVAFVGDWNASSFAEYYRSGAVRAIIYSDILANGTWHSGAISGGSTTIPTYSQNVSNLGDCDTALVLNENRSVNVLSCDNLRTK